MLKEGTRRVLQFPRLHIVLQNLLYLNDYRNFSGNLNFLSHSIRQLGEICFPLADRLKPNIEYLLELIHVPSITEVNSIERLPGVTVPVAEFVKARHYVRSYHS